MLSALTSYIWGTDDSDDALEPNQPFEDQLELEGDWIFVRPKETSDRRKHVNFNDDAASTASDSSAPSGMEESWLVTPPQCFNSKHRRNKNAKANPMENLLIEHPSMSIYQENEETQSSEDQTEERNQVAAHKGETHRAVAGRLQELAKRQPLKDLKITAQKNPSPKNMKHKNMVYVRCHNTRKNKQYGRMSGKHTAMVSKRAT